MPIESQKVQSEDYSENIANRGTTEPGTFVYLDDSNLSPSVKAETKVLPLEEFAPESSSERRVEIDEFEESQDENNINTKVFEDGITEQDNADIDALIPIDQGQEVHVVTENRDQHKLDQDYVIYIQENNDHEQDVVGTPNDEGQDTTDYDSESYFQHNPDQSIRNVQAVFQEEDFSGSIKHDEKEDDIDHDTNVNAHHYGPLPGAQDSSNLPEYLEHDLEPLGQDASAPIQLVTETDDVDAVTQKDSENPDLGQKLYAESDIRDENVEPLALKHIMLPSDSSADNHSDDYRESISDKHSDDYDELVSDTLNTDTTDTDAIAQDATTVENIAGIKEDTTSTSTEEDTTSLLDTTAAEQSTFQTIGK